MLEWTKNKYLPLALLVIENGNMSRVEAGDPLKKTCSNVTHFWLESLKNCKNIQREPLKKGPCRTIKVSFWLLRSPQSSVSERNTSLIDEGELECAFSVLLKDTAAEGLILNVRIKPCIYWRVEIFCVSLSKTSPFLTRSAQKTLSSWMDHRHGFKPTSFKPPVTLVGWSDLQPISLRSSQRLKHFFFL